MDTAEIREIAHPPHDPADNDRTQTRPSGGGGAGAAAHRLARPRRGTSLICVALAALLAVLGTAVMSSAVAAQTGGGSDEVRIVARKLSDDRIEFGLQQRQVDDSWGDRRLPSARFFPADVAVGRWLRSSPLTVSVAATANSSARDVVVRIVARKVADGRVEFGCASSSPATPMVELCRLERACSPRPPASAAGCRAHRYR